MTTAIATFILLFLVGFLIQLISARLVKRPGDLGITDGKLKECPATPNCVSTQATDPTKLMPPIPFSIERSEVIATVAGYIDGVRHTKIIEQDSNYLAVVFRTSLIGYPDDVEFTIDKEKDLLHFRSASRLGYSDLGTNCKRMTKLSDALTDLLKIK